MKMVIWSAAMLTAAAGTASAKAPDREVNFVSFGDGAPVTQDAGLVIAIPLNGIQSWDLAGDGSNVVLNIPLPAGAQVNGYGYVGSVTTIGPSWVSEFGILMTDSAFTTGIYAPIPLINGGPGSNNGNAPFNINMPVDKLPNIGYSIPSFTLGGDGILRLEFYEYYDDVADGVDGIWDGTLYIQYVPTPGTAGLLGLAGIAALGRKRRA